VTDDQFEHALIGIFAYDTGSVDSGIHDELLREQAIDELGAGGALLRLTRLVRTQFLSEEALAEGYSIEDAAEFIKWLRDRMEWDLLS
jgi:hypothetical protein